jgi:hypothetical protein
MMLMTPLARSVCVCAGPPTYDEVSSCVREQTNDRVCCVGERTRVVVVVVVD